MDLDFEQMSQQQRVPGPAEKIHTRTNWKSQHITLSRRWLFPLWIGVVYMGGMLQLWSTNSPYPINALWVMLFSCLMLMHALLYGTSAPGKMGRYQLFLYLAAQSFLTLITSFLSMYIPVLVGLYVALTVEIVYCLAPHREKDDHFWIWACRGAASAMIVTSLFAVNDGLSTVWVFLASHLKLAPRPLEPSSPLVFFAWRPFLLGLSEVMPFLLFVAGYAVLFLWQARARERARILLDELQAAHAQVTHYAARVETLTRSAERQRLARELHDTLAQGLVGLTMQLETVDLHLSHQRSERAQEVVRHAMTRTRALMMDARSAIDELRAQTTASHEFSAAVEQEILRFTVTTGIACTSHLEALALVPENLQEHILRTLREGLTNVARHARAHHIWIRITECTGWLEMKVRDDGIGFDVEAASQHACGHYGLLGLRERARLAGGSLEIRSTPGAGTTLRFRLPKSPEEDRHA